ncbi:hypothetical protein ABZ707_05100 [Streptomyces sp. NPDC006923]|uniref:hypothetical protein n=1 Tax=Streptomyces sp. NPDC006923 TaxID=3155355 RepID=UPI0033D59DE5
MQYTTFGRTTGLRVSEVALGTGTFGTRAAAGTLDAGQYRRLDEVSRVPLGRPHEVIASERSGLLGGDAARFHTPAPPVA